VGTSFPVGGAVRIEDIQRSRGVGTGEVEHLESGV